MVDNAAQAKSNFHRAIEAMKFKSEMQMEAQICHTLDVLTFQNTCMDLGSCASNN